MLEEAVWRLLIGNRGHSDAPHTTRHGSWSTAWTVALTGWVAQIVPELADRAAPVTSLDPATLFNLMVGRLALGPDPERASSDHRPGGSDVAAGSFGVRAKGEVADHEVEQRCSNQACGRCQARSPE